VERAANAALQQREAGFYGVGEHIAAHVFSPPFCRRYTEFLIESSCAQRRAESEWRIDEMCFKVGQAPNAVGASEDEASRLQMDILIQADGLTLTENLKDAVEEKVGRVVQYAPRALRARVRLRKVSAHMSPSQYVVRVLVELPGRDLSAEQIGSEPLLALDIVAEKIGRRLRKRKTRRLASRHTRSPLASEK